jgi:hypothetical protein
MGLLTALYSFKERQKNQKKDWWKNIEKKSESIPYYDIVARLLKE